VARHDERRLLYRVVLLLNLFGYSENLGAEGRRSTRSSSVQYVVQVLNLETKATVSEDRTGFPPASVVSIGSSKRVASETCIFIRIAPICNRNPVPE